MTADASAGVLLLDHSDVLVTVKRSFMTCNLISMTSRMTSCDQQDSAEIAKPQPPW